MISILFHFVYQMDRIYWIWQSSDVLRKWCFAFFDDRLINDLHIPARYSKTRRQTNCVRVCVRAKQKKINKLRKFVNLIHTIWRIVCVFADMPVILLAKKHARKMKKNKKNTQYSYLDRGLIRLSPSFAVAPSLSLVLVRICDFSPETEWFCERFLAGKWLSVYMSNKPKINNI